MKVCKDANGYFVTTSNNQKVELSYKGKVVTHLPTLPSIGVSHWYTNYVDEILDENNFEVLIDNISSFKALRWELFKYLEEQELDK